MDYLKFVRQDEVNDIFSYINCGGEIEYLKFPRSMAMTVKDVEDYLKE
jgi:glycosylphosphatidylinositol transamidase (GPIT) subunit GPI8